jgi:hypothetical protein
MEALLLSHFLPKGLLDNFLVTNFKELCFLKDKTTYFEVTLEEHNKILSTVDSTKYESKGFTEVTIQDFPIRGKAVYLVIRRRRWRHKENPKDVIRNDFSYVAEGSVLTKELSDFLKGTGRYKGRYD